MATDALKPAERFGLSRGEAADYIGVSTPTFDWMVAHKQMPEPRCIKTRLVWVRPEVEDALRNLPSRGDDFDAEAAAEAEHKRLYG